MVIDRISTPGLAQVAYLVADEAAGEAAVIDPRRDVDEYLAWAGAHRTRITAILETHVHADFVSGAHELALRTGAPLYASRLGGQAFRHEPLDDGDEVHVGTLRLRALWTPGHTPEHMSYLLFEREDTTTPIALFSGDALFVGDVGRPDLLGAEQTGALSQQLYETVSRRFAPLADDVVVYPGHTAGSSCGKNIGDAPHTTIGAERRANYAFQVRDRERFVSQVMEDMPRPPTYYPMMKRVNVAGATLLEALPQPVPLTPDRFADRVEDGVLVVDTRPADEFGEAHIPGAVFVGYGTNFVGWMGWIAPYDRDVVLVLTPEAPLRSVLTALRQIGIDRVAGYLEGGVAAWREAGYETAMLPRMDVRELATNQEGDDPLPVLDVRTPEEWRVGHIAGAHHLYAGEIAQGASPPASLLPSTPLAVICATGYRSSVAASLLAPRGYTNLINVAGGMSAWNDAGLAVTRES